MATQLYAKIVQVILVEEYDEMYNEVKQSWFTLDGHKIANFDQNAKNEQVAKSV